jgi:hypothetical protein
MRCVRAEIVADALREGRDVPALAPGARAATSRTAPTAARVVERGPVVDQEFEVNEPLDLSGAVEMSAEMLRPVSGDTIERGTLVMIDEAPAAVEPEPIASPEPVEPSPVVPTAPSIDEILSAAEKAFSSFGEWGITITAAESCLMYCGREQMRVTRKVGVDPLRQIASELAPRVDQLVTDRVKIIEDTERQLAKARDRLRDAEALAVRLRSVGA